MKKTSKWYRIIKSNFWILKEMSDEIWLSEVSIRKIVKTWNWKTENKEKILNFLENKNLIEKWKYTITEFFEV